MADESSADTGAIHAGVTVSDVTARPAVRHVGLQVDAFAAAQSPPLVARAPVARVSASRQNHPVADARAALAVAGAIRPRCHTDRSPAASRPCRLVQRGPTASARATRSNDRPSILATSRHAGVGLRDPVIAPCWCRLSPARFRSAWFFLAQSHPVQRAEGPRAATGALGKRRAAGRKSTGGTVVPPVRSRVIGEFAAYDALQTLPTQG